MLFLLLSGTLQLFRSCDTCTDISGEYSCLYWNHSRLVMSVCAGCFQQKFFFNGIAQNGMLSQEVREDFRLEQMSFNSVNASVHQVGVF